VLFRRTFKNLIFALALSAPGLLSAQPASIDGARSTVTIRVYKTGLFSGFAHNHSIKAPIASGTIDREALAVTLTFNVVDLQLADTEGSESDHKDIDATMKGPKVLDAAQFPTISFSSKRVDAVGQDAYKVTGDLKFHGAVREIVLPVNFSSGAYKGSITLKQTDFGITPVKIAGGAVSVKDAIDISFEVATR
jgi:polyisoprenoid-binding protein YceI